MTDGLDPYLGLLKLGGNVLPFLGDVKSIVNSDVISASFTGRGRKQRGRRKIKLKRQEQEDDPAIWWFWVEPLEDYAFVRLPANPSEIYELIGNEVGKSNHDARFWRWVVAPPPGVIIGGNSSSPNVLVDFVVVGYR